MKLIYGSEERTGIRYADAELGDLLMIESAQRFKGTEIGTVVYLGVYLPNQTYTDLSKQEFLSSKARLAYDVKSKHITILSPFILYPSENFGLKSLPLIAPIDKHEKTIEKVACIDVISVEKEQILARLDQLPKYRAHKTIIRELQKPYLHENYSIINSRIKTQEIKLKIKKKIIY